MNAYLSNTLLCIYTSVEKNGGNRHAEEWRPEALIPAV